MTFDIIQHLLTAVVTAVVFAIMSQQTCTYCDFHVFSSSELIQSVL